MKHVVDASVAIKWYVPEIFESEATNLQTSGVEFHAPDLILPEFSNILWKKNRAGDITKGEANNILDAFTASGVRLHPHKRTARSAFVGASMTGQTVYDWTYLALALALSCSFVTADAKFYKSLENTSIAKHLIWIGDC